MKRWVHAIASMKLAVTLLVLIVLAMATGTILESSRGAEAARSFVYGALWFRLLLALFAVNVIASLVDRYPWSRAQVGFVITHSSMLVILAGALVSALFAVEGRLSLWEGEESDRFVLDEAAPAGMGPMGSGAAMGESGSAGAAGSARLPFSVKLESFEIDYYQGTSRPAMFRSRVLVRDASGRAFPAVIEMNRELRLAGYRLFQSSYTQGQDRDQTVLSVSRDPGRPIVFAGYFLLLAGMLTVIGIRMAQARGGAVSVPGRSEAPGAARAALRAAVQVVVPVGFGAALFLGLLAGAGRARGTPEAPGTAAASETEDPSAASDADSSAARPSGGAPERADSAPGGRAPARNGPPENGHVPDAAIVEELKWLRVQHDGRVMPLDTMAREAVWQVTGRSRWQGLDPAALVLGWAFDPYFWAGQPLVPVGGDLAAAAGLAPGARRASFHDLVGNPRVIGLMQEADALEEQQHPLDPVHKSASRLATRLGWMQGFLGRRVFALRPAPSDPGAPWTVPAGLTSIDALVAFARGEGRAVAARAGDPGRVRAEILYNRIRPSRLAWWVLLGASGLALGAWVAGRRSLDVIAALALALGFAVMSWGLWTRWEVAGRVPAANMYESLLFLGWGAGLFALVALVFVRSRLVVFNAAAIAALTMMLADLLPIDPFIHPVAPVLSGTPWLAIHVPIIMTSYAVLALGVLVAHLQIGAGIFAPRRRGIAMQMFDLLYWYILVGSTLLIAGIITGSIWAASSWGRYWGWDPKEVWSLVAFLAYLAILHGRLDRLIGTHGVAALSIVAFWTILMTYIGVNYILATGLHSYGFGSSGVVRWLLIIAALETVFLVAGAVASASRERGRAAGSIDPAPA